MKPFTTLTGLVAPLDRVNVDTDQIIPKQFLKRIERTGFGEFAFFDWRYLDDGSVNPDFELNQPQYAGATILVTGENFGSGSSREHAPWALEDYGFRCLIAPSYADIFYNNCFKNGILPIQISQTVVNDIFRREREHGPGYRLTVDLGAQTVTDVHGLDFTFEIDPFRKDCLMRGLDDIGLTLVDEDKISAYEKANGIA